MSSGIRQGFSRVGAFLDLLASVAAFSAAVWLYWGSIGRGYLLPWPAEWFREILISAFTAWVAMAFAENPGEDGVRLWIDRFFSVVGFNLLIQYGLDYLFAIPPTPWPAAIGGSVLAIGLMGMLQRSRDAARQDSGGILLLGYDVVAEALAEPLASRIVGVLEDSPERVPAGLPVLGDFTQVGAAVAAHRPVSILIDDPACVSAISPRQLLALRYSGVAIEDGPALFEDLLQRVCWQRLDPLDLVVSSRMRINRSAMALQAVYTNLIGLALLLSLSPVLLVTAILVAMATRRAPLESIECPGFQRIPFHLLRFRTRRLDGELSWAGHALNKLHLVNLPQLINVVRGEMALFGPPPVRQEFADRLGQLLAAYPHRFAVKPGIIGWSQANLRYPSSSGPVPDESLRLSYDLYYAKQESPSLDLDIFMRTVFRMPVPADRVPAPGGQTAVGA